MADTAVAGGLMAHQKDEHDIWICKVCGWKYPNAKPSPKIRKNHKKNCKGKAGADAHTAGSSDDASDDEHHSSVKGSAPLNEKAVDDPVSTVPDVESNTRSFDFNAASPKEDLNTDSPLPEAASVNGNAKGAAAHDYGSKPAVAEKQGELDAKETPLAVPVAASSSGLMPHQKDEHDIWICKDCGWKYPNAKPSPKVRKHHKKSCPGKGGRREEAVGGSSDEASDDEHHHQHHLPTPAVPTEAAESGGAESGSAATVVADAPPGTSREIDLEALKESPSPEVAKGEPTAFEENSTMPGSAPVNQTPKDDPDTMVPPVESNTGSSDLKDASAKDDVNTETPLPAAASVTGNAKEAAAHDDVPTPAVAEKQGDLEAKEIPTAVPVAGSHSGLMLHQKDEHDIWICKDCGWKYPNAKPSAKVRKHHKKSCPGKGGRGEETVGGSSDEASDDEHHHRHHLPSPAAPAAAVESGGAENGSAAAVVADAPTGSSREIDFGAMKESPSPEVVKGEPTAVDETPAIAAAAPDSTNEPQNSSLTSSPSSEPAELEKSAPDEPGELSESVVEKEVASPEVETDVQPQICSVVDANEARSFDGTLASGEANATPTKTEKEEFAEETPEPVAAGGSMPHQKDEQDIWICKDCGSKYPNAKLSARIRKTHKKKCAGKAPDADGTCGGSSDEASDDEHQVSSPSSASGDGHKAPSTSPEAPCAMSDDGHQVPSSPDEAPYEASDDEHQVPSSSPAAAEVEASSGAPVEMRPTLESAKEFRAGSPDVPGSISEERDAGSVEKSPNPEVDGETAATITGRKRTALWTDSKLGSLVDQWASGRKATLGAKLVYGSAEHSWATDRSLGARWKRI